MFSHDERKQLWIALAGLLATWVGLAVIVFWNHFFGAIVAFIGALLLGVGALGVLRLTSYDQRKPLWIMLAGGFLFTVGFALTAFFSIYDIGSILSLIGAMIFFAGSVMQFVASKAAKPKLPNSVEEQRGIIRSMADDIRQESDN